MCVGLIEVEERKESESEDDNDFLAGQYLNEIPRQSVDVSRKKSTFKGKSAVSYSIQYNSSNNPKPNPGPLLSSDQD